MLQRYSSLHFCGAALRSVHPVASVEQWQQVLILNARVRYTTCKRLAVFECVVNLLQLFHAHNITLHLCKLVSAN